MTHAVRCAECQSQNIQEATWVDPNTGETFDLVHSFGWPEGGYCYNCEDNAPLELIRLPGRSPAITWWTVLGEDPDFCNSDDEQCWIEWVQAKTAEGAVKLANLQRRYTRGIEDDYEGERWEDGCEMVAVFPGKQRATL